MLQKTFRFRCQDDCVKVRISAFEAAPSRRASMRESRIALKRIPASLDESLMALRDFHKAVLDKELPHFFLGRLVYFERRSDELPERLTSSAARAAERKSPLKCNLTSILGLEFTLESLLAQKLVKDSAVLEGINAYLNHKWNAKQHYDGDENAPRTTPEEISFINGTIALVKKHLIEKYTCNIHYNKLHYWVAAVFHQKPPKNSPTPKWQARRALRNLCKSDQEAYKIFNPLYEATINGKLPQYYLGELKRMRDYSDDLPFHENKYKRLALVWDSPAYPNFKCRGNVMVGISLTLQAAMYEGIVKDPSIILAINKLRYYNFNAFRGSKGEYWTTPDEIKLINDTLDTVMDYLKREYRLQ